jgi:RNA polymerase sigma-70 factor (ECF subfamily)
MLLARRVRAGDRDACAQLVRAHHAAVYRFLLHLSRDAHAAEDLTQETFAAAWQKIGGFRGLASLSTWLHRIAYTKFVDWDRRSRRARSSGPEVAEDVGDPGPGPLDHALAEDWARRLEQALARLDSPAREVVVLHYFQGKSYRELAHVLGQPAGTVKWRLSIALEQLRSLIHEHPQGDRPRRPPADTTGRDARGAAPSAAPAAGAGNA